MCEWSVVSHAAPLCVARECVWVRKGGIIKTTDAWTLYYGQNYCELNGDSEAELGKHCGRIEKIWHTLNAWRMVNR